MPFFVPKLTAATIAILALIGLQELRAESHSDEDEADTTEAPSGRDIAGEVDPSIGGEANPGAPSSGTRRSGTTPTNTISAGPTATAPTSTPTATSAPTATLNATTTNTVVASLNAATSYCKQIEAKEYVIDCLAERLAVVTQEMAGLEGYEEVSKVLTDTANSLNQIAKQNRSKTLPPAWYATPGTTPIATKRPLIPVDDGKLESAMAQALTVIEDAEATLLLRSSEESADRASQYQRIASAIGSNKVLLRSTG